MNITAEIWDQGRTGFDFHAFVDGVALCHKGRKVTAMFASNAKDKAAAQKSVRNTPGAAMCSKCEEKFQATVTVEAEEIPADESVTPVEHTSYAGTGYVKDLMMGDVFRLPGNPMEVFGPVRSADSDYMLYGTTVDFGRGNNREWRAWTRIEHVKRGPKCECGRFLELCENGCPWPEEMEALFMAN
ncbi:hypothetical protein OTB20_08660 [Streptomyces sp. H27-H1]|uniref:hypothetical protein n=1 Tax=Streptomyces sp. H27-H1 TaxID=2996461 RepID=UPI00226FB42C|nr:hypothetical protein [Streptomyces sp. H27-H1]MCY0926277.1 hypothetical protein [Streptomyces sp. H27-H1]